MSIKPYRVAKSMHTALSGMPDDKPSSRRLPSLNIDTNYWMKEEDRPHPLVLLSFFCFSTLDRR